MESGHRQITTLEGYFHSSGNIVDTDGVACHFDETRNVHEVAMQSPNAIDALGALAQEHRLALFRLLVQAGQQGMSAGSLADALSVPNSSLSFHLAHLNRAGLIGQRRDGRSLIYTANYNAMNELVGYLMENCCGGVDCSPAASPKPERKSA